jgi:hypothetical protein
MYGLLALPALPERPLGDWSLIGGIVFSLAIFVVFLVTVARTWAHERDSMTSRRPRSAGRHLHKAA